VLDASTAAIERARGGGGPTFIEAPVYRFRAHGGAGDDSRTGYRAEAERDAWEPHDPVRMFGEYLNGRALLDAATLDAMERDIALEVADAFEHALASEHPTEADLHRFVYAD